MSATINITPEAVQRSVGVITSSVHKQAFLHKLAQLGHIPETEEEADHLVELGFKLASIDPSVRTGNPALMAATPRSKYAEAMSALDTVLGHDKQAETDEIYAAAERFAQVPQVYSSALTIKQAEALAQANG